MKGADDRFGLALRCLAILFDNFFQARVEVLLDEIFVLCRYFSIPAAEDDEHIAGKILPRKGLLEKFLAATAGERFRQECELAFENDVPPARRLPGEQSQDDCPGEQECPPSGRNDFSNSLKHEVTRSSGTRISST